MSTNVKREDVEAILEFLSSIEDGMQKVQIRITKLEETTTVAVTSATDTEHAPQPQHAPQPPTIEQEPLINNPTVQTFVRMLPYDLQTIVWNVLSSQHVTWRRAILLCSVLLTLGMVTGYVGTPAFISQGINSATMLFRCSKSPTFGGVDQIPILPQQ